MVNGCIYSLSNEKSIEIIMKVIIKSTLIKKKQLVISKYFALV